MKEKPLFTRFAFLAVLIVLAGLVLWSKPLKKGMDLEGGATLVFKVDTGGDSTVLSGVMDTLKERVDRQGTKNLQWRPVGKDRIEVSMPAGSKEAQRAKAAYLKALEALDQLNVTPAYIRQVLSATGRSRTELIDRKLGADTERGMLLAATADLHDKMTAEWVGIESGMATFQTEMAKLKVEVPRQTKEIELLQEKIDQLRQAYDVARGEHLTALSLLRSMNIRTRELSGILSLYVSRTAAKDLPAADVRDRKDLLAQRLEEYRKRYPQAIKAINDIVSSYTAWAEVRGRLDDPQDLIRLIRRAGVLEYRIAPRTAGEGVTVNPEQADAYRKQLAEMGPQVGRDRKEPFQWFKMRDPKEKPLPGSVMGTWAGQQYVLLSDQPDSTMLQTKGRDTWQLKDARPDSDSNLRPAISFSFDHRGTEVFAILTGNHVGELLAILLDDEVYSAPVIRTQIVGQGIIEGKFTRDEVTDLVRTLNAGSLRAKVNPEPVSVNQIGPALGAANISRGQKAAYSGLVAVVIFMAMYYLLSGMIANFALALNILFVLAAMSLFEVIFTLPGIAGVILTMGMAVDANVLIFERLREEQAKDQSLRQAMRKAYERAFSAIIDGNITTLLTCVILAWVGTPEVRGFGITLGIGLVTSLFTSLLATRWIFRLLIDTKLLKNKVLMLRMVGVPKVDWLGKRRTFWAVSAVVIVVGLVSLVVNRGDILGIEFRQGTRATVRFLDDATIDGYLLTDARVEETLKKSARKLGPLYERLAGQNVQVNELKTESRVADFIATYDATASGGNQDGAVSKAEWSAQHRDEKVFALLDANGDGRLDKADLNKTLPEPRYQITTAESRLEPVREAIAKAFVGKLSTQAQVDYKLLSGEPIAELDLAITTQGYHLITKSDLDNPTAGGSFREELMDNVGGSLMAFSLTDPDQAMTPADLSQRLRNTRLQAGREDVYVVHPQILPLQNVPNTDKFSAFAVVVRTDDIDPANSQAMNEFAVGELELLEDSLRTPQSLESLTNFDAAMTARTSQMAIVAIILSWVAMILYLWFRFGRILWGLAAVICLIHDTFVVVGLVAACGWISQTALGRALLIEPFKIDMAMIAAVLTVIGYSVNDTIVVFDRIRENRGKLKSINPEIINHSLNQTLSRTLMTSFTTLIVVVVMYIWGGAGIHGFSFALMVGIVFGTYSSMAIASPLLLGFKRAVVAKLTKRRAVGVPAGK